MLNLIFEKKKQNQQHNSEKTVLEIQFALINVSGTDLFVSNRFYLSKITEESFHYRL